MVLPFALLPHGCGVMEFPRFPEEVLAPGFVVGNHGGQSDPTGFLAVAPAQPLRANGLKRHSAAHQVKVAEISEHRVVWGQKQAATLGVLATTAGGLEEHRPSCPSLPMALARPYKVVQLVVALSQWIWPSRRRSCASLSKRPRSA